MNYQVESILLPKERNVCLAKGYKVSDHFLGGGAVGRVFLAEPTEQLIETNDTLKLLGGQDGQLKVAMKIVYADLGAFGVANLAKYLLAEISNLNKTFGHPNIIKLLDVFVSCKRIFMAMEYAAKGDLKALYRKHVANNPKAPFMEEDLARQYFIKILRGVQHLHQSNIAHRDLKLENILVTEDGEVKLADLGFSVAPTEDQKHDEERVFRRLPSRVSQSQCGTPGFMAPEVLRCTKASRMSSGYNAVKADLWSLGVVLFVLVNGQYPFPGKTPKEVLKQYEKVKSTSLTFRRGLSIECQDLINRLISYNPRSRPKVSEIMREPWINQDPRNHQGSPYPNPSAPSMEACRVSNHQKIAFQATYVRNYLIQRKELLKEARKCFLKSAKAKPEDLQNAGIRIRLPRRDTQGECVDEVWRFEAYQDRRARKVPNPFVDKPLENLTDPWVSHPDSIEPTLGIPAVRQELARAPPLLQKWREIRRRNKTPKTDLEKCVQLCNTVDLDPDRAWPPAEPPPRPSTQQWVEVLDFESRYPGNHSRISERGNLMILRRVPEQKFSVRDVLVAYSPQSAQSAAYRRRYVQTAGEISTSQTSVTRFTFYISATSFNESGNLKSKIPIHNSRKKLKKLNRKETMRRGNRSACASYSPRESLTGVKPNPAPGIVPIDLARVLHRDDRGFTRIPTPIQTPLHKLYSPRPPSTSESATPQNLSNAQASMRKSHIPEHSSRKVSDAYKSKVGKDEMRRRTLPNCAFSEVRGVDPKSSSKSVLRLLDVRNYFRDGKTNIPVPNFVEKTRQKIMDLYLSRKLQKEEATQNPGRLKKVSTTMLRKKEIVNWCKAKLFPTLFSYKSEAERTKSAISGKTTVDPKPVQFILNWKRCPKPEDRKKREHVSLVTDLQKLQNIRYRPHIRRGKGTKATYRPQLHASAQKKKKSSCDITLSSDRISPIADKQWRSGHREKNSIQVRIMEGASVSSEVAKSKNVAPATKMSSNKKVSCAETVLKNGELSKNRKLPIKSKVNETANSNEICQTQSGSLSSIAVGESHKQQAGKTSVLVKENENQSDTISEKVARLEEMSWRSLLDSDILETDLGASWSGPDADKLQVVKEWMGEDEFTFFRRSAFENYIYNLAELSDDGSVCSVCSNEAISKKVATKDSESPAHSSSSDLIPATTVIPDVDRIVNEMLGEESSLPCLHKLPVSTSQDVHSVENGLNTNYPKPPLSHPEQNIIELPNSDTGHSTTDTSSIIDSGETTPLLCDPEVSQFQGSNFKEVEEIFGYHRLSDEYLVRTELPKDTELDSNASDDQVGPVPYVQLSPTLSANLPYFSPIYSDASADMQEPHAPMGETITTVNDAIDENDKPASQSSVIEEYLPLIKSQDSKRDMSVSQSLTMDNDMSDSETELKANGMTASNAELSEICLHVSNEHLSKISLSATDTKINKISLHVSDAQLSGISVSDTNLSNRSMSASDKQLSQSVLRESHSQLSERSIAVSEAQPSKMCKSASDTQLSEKGVPVWDTQLNERDVSALHSQFSERMLPIIDAQLSERVLPLTDAQLSERWVPAWDAQFSKRDVSVSHSQLTELSMHVSDAQLTDGSLSGSDAQLNETCLPVSDAKLSERSIPESDTQMSERFIISDSLEVEGGMPKSQIYLPERNPPVSNSHESTTPASSTKSFASILSNTTIAPACDQVQSRPIALEAEVQTSKASTFAPLLCETEEAVIPVLPKPLHQLPSVTMTTKIAKVAKAADRHQKDKIKTDVETKYVENRLIKKDEGIFTIYTNKEEDGHKEVKNSDRNSNRPATRVQNQQRQCESLPSNRDHDLETQFPNNQTSHSRQITEMRVTDCEFSKTMFINVTLADTVSIPGEKASAKVKPRVVFLTIKVPYNADNKSRATKLVSELCSQLPAHLSKHSGTHETEEEQDEQMEGTDDSSPVQHRQCESVPNRLCRDVATQTCASQGMQSQTGSTDGKSTQTVTREIKLSQKDDSVSRSTQVVACENKATQKCLSVSKSTQAIEVRPISTQTDSIKDVRVHVSKRSRHRKVGRENGNASPLCCSQPQANQYAAPPNGPIDILPDNCYSLSGRDRSLLFTVEKPRSIPHQESTVQLIPTHCSIQSPATAQNPMSINNSRPNRSHPYANRLTTPLRDPLPSNFVTVTHPDHQSADQSQRRTPSEASSNAFVPLSGVSVRSLPDIEEEQVEMDQNKGDLCTPPQSVSPPRDSFEEMRAFVSRMQIMQRHVAQNYGSGATTRNRSPSHGYRSYWERIQRLDPNNRMGSSLFSWQQSHENSDVDRESSSFTSNRSESC